MTYQRCEDCGAAVFPARGVCPACGSRALREERSAGRGAVYSTTTVHRREGSHDVSLVDLDEGFRMMSTVLAGEVRIGMTVAAHEDEDGRVVFAPADG